MMHHCLETRQSPRFCLKFRQRMNSASPCPDAPPPSCRLTAGQLPARGPLELPLSCTPGHPGSGRNDPPPGWIWPGSCRPPGRKCERLSAECAAPHPNPAESLGVLGNTGFRASRLAGSSLAPRALPVPAGRAHPRRVPDAGLLRTSDARPAQDCSAARRQLPRGHPLNRERGPRRRQVRRLCERHYAPRGERRC